MEQVASSGRDTTGSLVTTVLSLPTAAYSGPRSFLAKTGAPCWLHHGAPV